jgi:hypothetical protein
MARSLLLLINRVFFRNEQGTLVHRLEMLNHIQRLSGLPRVPSGTLHRIITRAVLGLGIVAMLMYVVVFPLAVLWFVIAAATDIKYFVPSESSCLSTAFIISALFMCTYVLHYLRSDIFQDNYIVWHYPCRVIALSEQLREHGVLAVGQVVDTQRTKEATRIDYSFSSAGKTINGYYLTRPNCACIPGDILSVRYLDDTIHLPVFDFEGQQQ